MATLSTLEPYLANRCEEVPGSPVFWGEETEFFSALMEAQCDLMLLVGRPDQTVSQVFTIQPNTWLQQVPKGIFAITNMQGPSSEVWKVTLEDMDYGLVSGPDWEEDIADTIQKWFPIGLGQFGVWPSVSTAQNVLITGIASPIIGIWPYDGSQPVVFEDQFFVALEKYASCYARLKEAGNEAEEGYKLYQEYLANAARMTQIQDRRDPYLFQGATGATTVVNPTKMR
jgi:hypothetical protein